MTAPRLSARLGPGECLALTLGGTVFASVAIGVSSHWLPVLGLFAVIALLGILWNVITVSLRQSIIPPRLLGRANSVYRFFAWGMMPVGAAIGGGTVVVVEQFASREMALRSTWFLCALVHVALFWLGRRHLTTAAITAARDTATKSRPALIGPVRLSGSGAATD